MESPASYDNPPRPIPRGRRTGQLSGLQIMFAAILAIGLILGLNFTSLISNAQPLQTLYGDVTTEIAQLKREQGNLIRERDYAASDAYVEQWARDEGRMLRPGERLIVPVPVVGVAAPTPVPQPTIAVETRPAGRETWQVWWSLFFDSQPPDLGS